MMEKQGTSVHYLDDNEKENYDFSSTEHRNEEESSGVRDTDLDLLTTSLDDQNKGVDIPLTEAEKKRKQIFNRARSMPITKTQKRARWVPGSRYMPILLVQRLWHPISNMLDDRKASGHINDNKLHQDYYNHHHHHHDHLEIGRSASTPGRQMMFSPATSGGDLFME